MTALWTVAEVVAATGGRAEALPEGDITAVSIDSREIEPGALFVAIRGDVHDGHAFVDRALQAGAAVAIVSDEWFDANGGERLIVVPDPLQALRDLGKAARARSEAFIVAVTGSAGKTTTKEAIRTVFQAAGPTHFSIKSFNNHWGVPLMLARFPREARFGVFEIGMNHAGEITPLVGLVRPHLAVITTVAAAHLEFFNSVAEIAEAKAEIFTGLVPGGTALLNADHAHLDVLLRKAAEADVTNVVTYGFSDGTDWHIEAPEQGDGRTHAEVTHAAERFALDLQVKGRHMVANATAALAAAELGGVAADVALTALSGFGAPEGRGETTRLGPAGKPLLLVDESYNANVASMTAALDVFASVRPPMGRKVLVLGDMLEMGPQGAELHRSLETAVLSARPDRIFLVGDAIRTLNDALPSALIAGYATSIDALLDRIVQSLAYGDAIMVKGSKGVRLSLLVASIRERFGPST